MDAGANGQPTWPLITPEGATKPSSEVSGWSLLSSTTKTLSYRRPERLRSDDRATWRAYDAPVVSKIDSGDYADTVRLHLQPGLGSKVRTKLSVSELNALWASKRRAGYSANSIRIMGTVLRSALHQAEREELLVRNVAALSDPPRIGQSEGRSLTVAEARHLLDAASSDRLKALYAITITLGLRRGERRSASPGRTSISTQDSCQIRRQLRRERLLADQRQETGRKTHLVFRDLKTKKSRRTLHVTPAFDGLLRSTEPGKRRNSWLLDWNGLSAFGGLAPMRSDTCL